MKVKTFDQYIDEKNEYFDSRVNDFIKDKQVIQITTNRTASGGVELTHSLTVLYEEEA
jgi:hypothetical protein